jgi:methylthioribulose-1-phosphate dehydratase
VAQGHTHRKRAGKLPRNLGAGARFRSLAADLATTGREFYSRGWVQGTSGNFSAVVSREPLRLAITSTGLDKRALSPSQFLEIDGAGKVLRGSGRPSSEVTIHLSVVRNRGAGAVLHTHSVWNTILSEAFAAAGGIALEGYEMLKGLDGINTHEHREWLPILENSQDMLALATAAEAALEQYPGAHGLLLRRHGLYTWGRDLAEAKRHVEILEFLMEVVGRTYTGNIGTRAERAGGAGR